MAYPMEMGPTQALAGPTMTGGEVVVQRLDLLPLVLATLRRLRVAEVIDAAIGPPSPGPQAAHAHATGQPEPAAGPSPGTCAEAMILNVFEGRVALSQMEAWLRPLPVAACWGPTIQPAQFTDDRLARALDRIHAAEPDTLYTQIVVGLLQTFPVATSCVHSDTTSLPVWGAFDVDDAVAGPRAVHGYSKNHRPDLLQFVFGMTVQGDGLPLVSTLQDGNTSDPLVYRSHLELLRTRLPTPEATTFVGDSKLCAAGPLGELRAIGWQVTTLLPHTFGLHAQLCAEALACPDAWVDLGGAAAGAPTPAEAPFRGCVLTCPLDLAWPQADGETTPCQERFHALVVRSPPLAQTQAATRAARLARSEAAVAAAQRRLAAQAFACEADATAAVATWIAAHAVGGLTLTGTVTVGTERARRPGRGRPKAGEVPVERTVWRPTVTVTRDAAAEAQQARTDGLFILVTSRRIDAAYPPATVLQDYRGQHQVESGFRWLKDPARIGPLLLHTPARIEALAFLFTVTLLVYRLLQWQIRRALAATGTTVPGHNGVPTARPTLDVVQRLFTGIYRVWLPTPAGRCPQLVGFHPLHRRILALVDLPPDLYEQATWVPASSPDPRGGARSPDPPPATPIPRAGHLAAK
jgi:transposase